MGISIRTNLFGYIKHILILSSLLPDIMRLSQELHKHILIELGF